VNSDWQSLQVRVRSMDTKNSLLRPVERVPITRLRREKGVPMDEAGYRF